MSTRIDCCGQRCPQPVIELARAIQEVTPGSVVEVVSDDPAAATDIPAWCRLRGHTYVGSTEDTGAATTYRIQRQER